MKLKITLNVFRILPEHKNVIAGISEEFTIHKKAVVSKTAKSLVQTIPSVS